MNLSPNLTIPPSSLRRSKIDLNIEASRSQNEGLINLDGGAVAVLPTANSQRLRPEDICLVALWYPDSGHLPRMSILRPCRR